MNQIEQIVELFTNGKKPSEIAELFKIDIKTVKKYCSIENFSDENPIQKKKKTSKIDTWVRIINQWLEDDKKMRYKQRHTAKRIHERLKKEYQGEYDCSYSSVQRYCKSIRQDKNKQVGNQELVWHKGEAQGDFGEADFIENGLKVTKKYFCLTFPYSNAGFMQIFGGETAECVVQGLLDIFYHIGGVPVRIVFDNASGVGKRVKENITLSELFSRFKCHYGFNVTFCNPYSGHEKGNVENKVGYFRRNYFVPITEYSNIIDYNRLLLKKCDEDNNRTHYKKESKIIELFNEDRSKLLNLPVKQFNPVRFEKFRTDNYGKICLNGKHFYSTSPDYAGEEVIAEIGAHTIKIMAQNGTLITVHPRKYGLNRTDSNNWETTIGRLIRNPGSWQNSGVREQLPDILKDKLDSYDKSGLKDALKLMKSLTEKYAFGIVIEAMSEVVKNSRIDSSNSLVIIQRILSTGLNGIASAGPDLNDYDSLLEKKEVVNG